MVATPKIKILIDVGLSGKETEQRLATLGLSLEDIDAVFITHEHSDHINGLKAVVSRRNIPVYANAGTAKAIVESCKFIPVFKVFTTGESFTLADMEVHPFTIQHDTMDPVAFTLHVDGIKLGVCTDLGFATSLVQHHLQGCHYLHLESNHDVDMVWGSKRPPYLKQRILGRNGHLSNEQCVSLLEKVVHSELRHIHLAHLSSECNHPEKALTGARGLIASMGLSLEVDVAPQERCGRALCFA